MSASPWTVLVAEKASAEDGSFSWESQEWYQEEQRKAMNQKNKKLPPMAHRQLERWLETGDDEKDLSYCTFQAIVKYKRDPKSVRLERVKVACGDIGFTLQEMEDAKSAKEIAQEVVNRGIESDSDDDDSDE